MFQLEREVQSVPSEEQLTGELQALNRRLLDLNAEAGRVEQERRSVQHKLRETSKLLQRIQARRVKAELTGLAGTVGPRR